MKTNCFQHKLLLSKKYRPQVVVCNTGRLEKSTLNYKIIDTSFLVQIDLLIEPNWKNFHECNNLFSVDEEISVYYNLFLGRALLRKGKFENIFLVCTNNVSRQGIKFFYYNNDKWFLLSLNFYFHMSQSAIVFSSSELKYCKYSMLYG